jgi:hypothetical protein
MARCSHKRFPWSGAWPGASLGLAIGPETRLHSRAAWSGLRPRGQDTSGVLGHSAADPRSGRRADRGLSAGSSVRLVQSPPIGGWDLGTHARLTEPVGSPKLHLDRRPCGGSTAGRTSGDQEGHRVAPGPPAAQGPSLWPSTLARSFFLVPCQRHRPTGDRTGLPLVAASRSVVLFLCGRNHVWS